MLTLNANFDGPDPGKANFKNESDFVLKEPKFQNEFDGQIYEKAKKSPGYLFDFELLNLAKPNNVYREPVKSSDIVFLVLGARKLYYRSLSQVRTWLIWADHYYLVTDKPLPDLPNYVVVSAYNNRSHYESAGERHWRSVLWLEKHKPELMSKKWFVLLDDDTWMNVPALCRYLRDFNPDWNVVIGEVSHNHFLYNRTFLQGGAGEVFSRTAFAAMARVLFTRGCRYNRHGDSSLWSCYKVAYTTQIHSDKFSHYSVPVEKFPTYYALYPPNYLSQISFHHMNNYYVKMTLTCDVAKYWNVAEPKECEMMRKNPKKTYVTKLPALNNLGYPFFGYGFHG